VLETEKKKKRRMLAVYSQQAVSVWGTGQCPVRQAASAEEAALRNLLTAYG
jgi:hypothetical protein